MATFTSDDFTGAEFTSLSSHTPSGGGSWTLHPSYSNPLQISNANRAKNAAGSGSGAAYHSGTPATAEHDITGDFTYFSGGGTEDIGICGRMSTTANTMYMWRYVGNGWQLFKFVAGSATLLGSWSQSVSAGSTQAGKLEIRGAAKKGFVEGVERVSSSDNAITAAGRAGIRAFAGATNTSSTHIDNFVAADPVGGSGITGTATITLDGVTSSSAAVSPIEGSAAVQLDDVTAVAAGVSPVAGTATVSLDDVISTASAVSPISSAATLALDDVTCVATGGTTAAIEGLATITLDDVTCVAAGDGSITGNASIALDGVSVSADAASLIAAAATIFLEDVGVTSADTVGGTPEVPVATKHYSVYGTDTRFHSVYGTQTRHHAIYGA